MASINVPASEIVCVSLFKDKRIVLAPYAFPLAGTETFSQILESLYVASIRDTLNTRFNEPITIGDKTLIKCYVSSSSNGEKIEMNTSLKAIDAVKMFGAYYVQNNKGADNDWFRLESNKEGTRWFGKCWYIHELLKYEFDLEFDVPVMYPTTAPELAIPELDGKTAKMYRGGKICLTDHFKPLWARNVPKFGIAHAMALGLGPWLAVEVPDLIQKGIITHKDNLTIGAAS